VNAVGYRFSLVLSREITEEETAILQDAGCACAVFGSDSLPTNAEVTVTKMEFDDTASPSLADAIQSALDAVKSVPELTVPGLTVPAQPAGPVAAEAESAETESAEQVQAQAAGQEQAAEPDAVLEGVVLEQPAPARRTAKKPAATKARTRKPAAVKASAEPAPAPAEGQAEPAGVMVGSG
jgi:hypothetical protein